MCIVVISLFGTLAPPFTVRGRKLKSQETSGGGRHCGAEHEIVERDIAGAVGRSQGTARGEYARVVGRHLERHVVMNSPHNRIEAIVARQPNLSPIGIEGPQHRASTVNVEALGHCVWIDPDDNDDKCHVDKKAHTRFSGIEGWMQSMAVKAYP